MNFSKEHLIKRFSIDSGLNLDDAKKIANAFLYSFRSYLSEMIPGETLEIRDFMKFEMVLARGRSGARNPKTGKEMMIPAHRRLKIKISSTLRREFRKLR